MIDALRESLLDALEYNGDGLIYNTIRAIQHSLESKMCTLWSINHNTTRHEVATFDSASLIARIMSHGMNYPYSNNDDDYAHGLENCFIKHALDVVNKSGVNYLECTIEDCSMHLSYQQLKEMGFAYFICIPIIQGDVTIAFLKLAYFDNPHLEDDLPKIVDVINKAVISAINRNIINQKQSLINDLIENYKLRGNQGLQALFEPVISNIFRKYFDYEGASIFLWDSDSYSNQYYLLVTTGLKGISNTDEVFYQIEEGLTGLAASKKRPIIYDNLKDMETTNPKYLHKYREFTEHDGRTLLLVPIFRPSNPDKVFGIIRFTNKINKQSVLDKRNVVDFFNVTDVELINNASHYLALNIDNYLAEKERMDFISKMSHESSTPANSIKRTAERILMKMSDERFMGMQFQHYIQSIIDYAHLQLMQASTNLYLSKINARAEYDRTGSFSIVDIIKDSINVVRPFARDHDVTFNNIVIQKDFPRVFLRIDRDAFIIIFYNLLTNAIKYVRDDTDFYVEISAKETPDNLIIDIKDYGIGIRESDSDRIFLLGVRSIDAQKTNSEGYGIGLHVVQQILRDFNCDIRVSNFKNPTAFEITIPRSLYSYKKV